MKLRSLGYKSDLIFTDFDGKVEDRGHYLVVRTLSNPNFFWGNLLIFDRPPRESDYEEWTALFKQEFNDPRIYHVTLAWDSPAGEVGDVSRFVANGFELEKKSVLAASRVVKPPKFVEGLEIRPLEGNQDWEAMIAVQVAAAHDNLPKHEWEKFYRSQSQRYQALSRAGWGHWFGGFLDGRLVTGLGVFGRGELGRYQIVCTHPDFARQGLAGTLVYKSAVFAFQQMGLRKLVMCADPDYHAAKIYQSVGFQEVQREHGVYWWDKSRT